jgi:hypothetical protein
MCKTKWGVNYGVPVLKGWVYGWCMDGEVVAASEEVRE